MYDPQYALRLCTEQHLEEACVHIYAAMDLYEEAVDRALLVSLWGKDLIGQNGSPSLSLSQVDVDLAREIAGTPLRNKDLQRKLWLKIAQHVIKKENNIQR